MSETATVQALKAHLALNVRDVDQSREFYQKMLGIEPSKVRKGYAKFDVQNPPLNLTLNQVPFGERGALSHMGIQVSSTADVMAMRDKWEKAGLVSQDEMQTNCCYALQDKSWVHDPDGNAWEVFVVLEDNLAASPACCGTGDKEEETVLEAKPSEPAVTCAPASATTGSSACCGEVTAPTAITR